MNFHGGVFNTCLNELKQLKAMATPMERFTMGYLILSGVLLIFFLLRPIGIDVNLSAPEESNYCLS